MLERNFYISDPNISALKVIVCRLFVSKVWKAFTHHTVSTAAVLNKEDGQCTYKRNIKAPSCNHCCTGKAMCYTGCVTTYGHFLGLCDQKYSYKHVSDFGRLRSYGHFLILVHALVWTASYETSWRVMYWTWWLIVCGSCYEQLAQFTTERHTLLRPVVAFSKTSFKHGSIQIKGNSTKLTLHLYFKCIMYYAGLLFCSVYCQ